MRHVYICGLGALGSMYASRFIAAGVESVHAVIGSDRLSGYQGHTALVNGATLPISYLTPDNPAPAADLILLSVKWHQLADAIDTVRSFVGPGTIILSILNGIESEEIVARAFGEEKVLHSFAVRTDAVRVGRHTRYGHVGTIVFGERENLSNSPNVEKVRQLLQRCGIDFEIPRDMIREMWWKFMLNVSLNQASAVLRAPYRVFQSVPEARELVRMISREVLAVAGRKKIHLSEEDIDALFGVIDRLSPDAKTSMLQDIEASRKTEVEIFGGTIVKLGQSLQVATPMNAMLFNMIRTLEKADR